MINKFSAEWLQARSEIVAVLVREGALEVNDNDQAGFWRGEEFVRVYDLLDGVLA